MKCGVRKALHHCRRHLSFGLSVLDFATSSSVIVIELHEHGHRHCSHSACHEYLVKASCSSHLILAQKCSYQQQQGIEAEARGQKEIGATANFRCQRYPGMPRYSAARLENTREWVAHKSRVYDIMFCVYDCFYQPFILDGRTVRPRSNKVPLRNVFALQL